MLQSGNFLGSGGPYLHSPTVVKKAVRTSLVDRADEVGREANVLIFGLKEEESETVGQKDGEMLQVFGKKLSLRPSM